MNAKVNHPSMCETIKVKLSPINTPIAYHNKLEELVENGLSVGEAREALNDMEFEMELIYHKNHGLFMVESFPLESIIPYSPYGGSLCDSYEDDEK